MQSKRTDHFTKTDFTFTFDKALSIKGSPLSKFLIGTDILLSFAIGFWEFYYSLVYLLSRIL